MKSLLVKGLPEAWHKKLKERAQEHRRSLNQEALTILGSVLNAYEIPQPSKTFKLKKPVPSGFWDKAIRAGRT